MHLFDNETHRGLNDWYLQNVIVDQLEVILSHGPYAKGLSLQEGYPDQCA